MGWYIKFVRLEIKFASTFSTLFPIFSALLILLVLITARIIIIISSGEKGVIEKHMVVIISMYLARIRIRDAVWLMG